MPHDLELLLGLTQPARKQSVGYALVDQNLNVLANNAALNEWVIGKSEWVVGQPLVELFPELIGLEESLRSLAQDQAEAITLPKIYRAGDDEFGRYFDLQIEPMFYFGSVLLVTAADVTAQAKLEQELRHERNELRLQVKERQRAEEALQQSHARLEAAVAERTAELKRVVEQLRLELEERQRAEAVRAKLEEQLRQAYKMEAVGRLAGGVAHDFNNLLTVISGYCDLLLQHPKTQEEDLVYRYISEIRKAGERAAALTKQLLAFSRKQVMQTKVLNLNSIVTDMEKMIHRLIGEHIELVIALAPDLKPIKADPHQLEQVLLNLAINARDAMPEGGRLLIETSQVMIDLGYASHRFEVLPGEYVQLTVSDTGIGMTEEVKAHLFEPFFTTKDAGYGTGLGLATCFGIVKQSGGHIEVYSEPEHGTNFKVYLPIVEETVASPVPQSEDTEEQPLGSEAILLVEDEPMVREFAVRVLQRQGYTVIEASNGEEGLAKMHQQPPGQALDLLITDVVMPRLSGKELAEQLKNIYPALKVLFISGYTGNTVIHQHRLGPNVAFLQKPFSPGALAHKVREVLDNNPDF
ncbi:MAG: ATP-binding protein [Anaerolineae bacterium]